MSAVDTRFIVYKTIFYILILVLLGCSKSSNIQSKLGNSGYSNEPVGVYLIPVFGADSSVVRDLEDRLQTQHKIRIKSTTEMGLDDHHFDQEHQQFIAEEIVDTALDIVKRLRGNQKFTPAIVVIPGDLNSQDFRFRFFFSRHFIDQRISVVSLARIDPRSYRQAANHSLVLDRLTKLVNKALGYHLYDYRPTSNRGNVMYGPIMGLDDLDSVNMWYR